MNFKLQSFEVLNESHFELISSSMSSKFGPKLESSLGLFSL